MGIHYLQMSEGKDFLMAERCMKRNRRYTTGWLIALSLMVLTLCSACGKTPAGPAEDKAKADLAAEYLAPVQEEADAYFAELSEAAIGSRPAEIRIRFRNANIDFLSGETKSLSELLENDGPVLLVGFISASEKGYSAEEIRAIILETEKRDIIVDLYFNYNDDYVYQVRSDGVVIDKATGKDGGAMREQIPYETAETEEENHE